MDTINISIEGYWREIHKKALPAYPGIFLVYQSKYDEELRVISLLRLLYIGEGHNIRDEVEAQKVTTKCSQYLKPGEELSYSTGFVRAQDMTRVRAAFVFKHQPEANTKYKTEYPFESINIALSGKTKLLETNFTVSQFDKK